MSVNAKFVEENIIRRLKLGEEGAFKWLYEHTWERLYNQAYRRLADEEQVKELLQELFTEIWQNRKQLNIQISLQGYLHQALKYKIYNHFKSQKIQNKYLEYLKVSISHLNNQNTLEEELRFNELQNILHECILKLPPQAQKVYLLRQNNGLSNTEIANILNLSISTVEKHMINAVKLIRASMKYRYLTTITYIFIFFQKI